MQQKVFDTTHPYNLGNYNFVLTVRILTDFVKTYNTMEFQGIATKIQMDVGNGKVNLVPNAPDKIGFWRGRKRAADVIFERLPPELLIVDLKHIQWIKIDVNSI